MQAFEYVLMSGEIISIQGFENPQTQYWWDLAWVCSPYPVTTEPHLQDLHPE